MAKSVPRMVLALSCACSNGDPPEMKPPTDAPADCDTALSEGTETSDTGTVPLPPALPPPCWAYPWNGFTVGGRAALPPDEAVAATQITFRWGASFGADTYELEIDDTCDLEAFTGCTFPSPEATIVTASSTLVVGGLPAAIFGGYLSKIAPKRTLSVAVGLLAISIGIYRFATM